jgi:pimeloyl-ACP methyl ester carboxylesterase
LKLILTPPRSYAELFTPSTFSHMIFVDQSPLQNSTLDGWDSRFCNRGMNTPSSLAALQTTLTLSPETAHRGTIASCLAYRSHPLPSDNISPQTQAADEAFFLGEAMKGDADWYGRLMADHTSLDWRDTVINFYNLGCEMETPKVLVVASSRSGCFPAEGPMKVVEYINGVPGPGNPEDKARGVVVDWGGHWCYWEDPERFNGLCLEFLNEE